MIYSEFTSRYYAGNHVFSAILSTNFATQLFPNLAGQARWSQRAPLHVQLDRVTSTELATDTGASSAENQRPQAGCHCQRSAARSANRYRLRDCSVVTTGHRQQPVAGLERRITTESMTTWLERLKIIVAKPTELQNFPEIADYVQRFTQGIATSDQALAMQSLFNKEVRVSSFLLFLSRHKPSQLNELFLTAPPADHRPAV